MWEAASHGHLEIATMLLIRGAQPYLTNTEGLTPVDIAMYGIFTYIWAIFGEHVGKYSICGAYGSGVLASDVYRTPGLKNHAAWLMSMRLSSKRNMPK